jgi:hypothetical protein
MMTLEERVAALEAKLAALTQPRKLMKVFNPERDAALREHWQAGKRATEILPILNAIPATLPVSSAQAVTSRAMKLHLKRPEGWKAATLSDSATTVWHQERQALLRAEYGRMKPQLLLEAINTLPGQRIESVDSMRRAAARFRIRSARLLVPGKAAPPPAPKPPRAWPVTPAPEPEPQPLTPEEQEAAVAAAWARKHARAMELFAQGKSAEAVSASIKVPLREAFRLQAMHREQQKEAA